jgi:hypothetical protein
MINNSEDQATFIEHLRRLADGELRDPAEAVRSYHAGLEKLGIAPHRNLEQDLGRADRQSAYGGSGAQVRGGSPAEADKPAAGSEGDKPDFANMSQQEKLAWNRQRLDRTLGL